MKISDRKPPVMNPRWVPCKGCGKLFWKTNAPQRYCSKECSGKAYQASIKKAYKKYKDQEEEEKRQRKLASDKKIAEVTLKNNVQDKSNNNKPKVLIDCEICGKPILKKSPKHKYCADCAKKLEAKRDKERKSKEKDTKSLTSYVNDGAMKNRLCKVAKQCVYGEVYDSIWGCGYLHYTKTCRSHGQNEGLHEIKNGKCDLYRNKRQRKR